jgi:hypothetical protein
MKIFNIIIKIIKPMTELRTTTDAYNDAIELQPSLDVAVQTAIDNLKPYQDALALAQKNQADNTTLSEDLRAKIVASLTPPAV